MCLINPIVLLYTHESVSFQFFLHIFFVHKNVTVSQVLLFFTYSQSVWSVAVTDLFPLVNQCPRQAIQPNTNQSGAEPLIPPSSLELYFLILFGSRSTAIEHLVSSQDRPLFRVLCYGQSTCKNFTEEHTATSFTHRRTSLVVSHTSYLL